MERLTALYTAALVEMVRFLFRKTPDLSLPKAAETRPMQPSVCLSMVKSDACGCGWTAAELSVFF